MKVSKGKLAEESRLHDYVGERDFLDSYIVEFPKKDVPIEEIVQRLFLDFPAWVQVLLNFRDGVVRVFGLKTTADLAVDKRFRATLRAGERVNFFRIETIEENEVIVGEDDNHLDFRIAIRRDHHHAPMLSLSTWVRPHNFLGKLYLRLILPFHILIVTSRLKGVARHFT